MTIENTENTEKERTTIGDALRTAIKDAKEAELSEKPDAEAKTVTDQPETQEAEAAKPIDAPVSWSADAKERFSKLPPDVQQVIAERESEREKAIATKAQEAAQFQKQLSKYNEVFNDEWRNHFAMQGMDETAAMRVLMTQYAAWKQDPAKFIQAVAEQSGIDLHSLIGQQQPQNRAPQNAELTKLREQVESLQRHLSEGSAQAQEAAVRSIVMSKTADGQPRFPLWGELEGEVMIYLQGLKQAAPDRFSSENMDAVIQEAYDRALWANPKAREKAMAETEERKKREIAEKSEAAKKAASGLKAKPASDVPGKKSSFREGLLQEIRAARSN